MKKTVSLKPAVGCRIIEKTHAFKVQDAQKILLSDKQRHYICAVRSKDDIALTASYVVCPHCCREVIYNSEYSEICDLHKHGSNPLDDNQIYSWCSIQHSVFSLFGESVLKISDFPEKLTYFICPDCDLMSEHSDAFRDVQINIDGKKITLRSEILGIEEFFCIKWIKHSEINLSFPMYEKLIFNLESGKVFAVLEDSTGVISREDVTMRPEKLSGSAVCNLIYENKAVKQQLEEFFGIIWNRKLPYTGDELSFENLVKMTMFVGYDAEFYTSIPYADSSLCIDTTFRKYVKLLHFADNVVQIYKNSGLPQKKSVKRSFFESPGLMFYKEEAEKLWEIFGDVNIFCEILESPVIFDVLSEFHMRPSIVNFFRDYCDVMGKIYCKRMIIREWRYICEKAVFYVTMSSAFKKKMRSEWKTEEHRRNSWKNKCHSIPISKPDKDIKDCMIDGFRFFWLINTNDYRMASRELKNCLECWNSECPPVVCVKKKSRYVAAIEISNKEIVQMLGYENNIISDPSLEAAINKWINMYGLRKKISDSFYNDIIDVV